MNAKEKAAYVKGLVSGMKLDENRDETKIFNAIIDWMETISKSVSEIEEDIEDICDDLEDMNEDLAHLENKCGGSCDCGCDCECSCEDDCDCGCHGECDEDDKFYQVSCPNCKERVCLSEDVICNKDVKCPNCSANLEIGCKCCCGHECEEEYSSSSTSYCSEED